LSELVDDVARGGILHDVSRQYLKSSIKNVYQDFLEQFTGTIVTPPTGASVSLFETSFRPDLVVMDEAAVVRELTALLPIAFLDPKAWILTGDVAQKPPHLNLEHD